MDDAEFDEMEEEELEERLKRAEQTGDKIYSGPPSFPPQPPLQNISAWPPQSIPAPPAYGPWSTGSQQRPPTNGRG
jgi:hypothetical protein